ncbi:hypothetical protein PSACC_03189 [Paramicrosporidium saccamoebae]|uniref:Uncharacterized protein n=1 Tax=Paramicrosporidium saccamoebae TaxID=1246581 RepID=A0A2H9TH15_9FUNG|nr:hypothetical protein PSACC_03189 [Paramicrosporidium saccamoebae]
MAKHSLLSCFLIFLGLVNCARDSGRANGSYNLGNDKFIHTTVEYKKGDSGKILASMPANLKNLPLEISKVTENPSERNSNGNVKKWITVSVSESAPKPRPSTGTRIDHNSRMRNAVFFPKAPAPTSSSRPAKSASDPWAWNPLESNPTTVSETAGTRIINTQQTLYSQMDRQPQRLTRESLTEPKERVILERKERPNPHLEPKRLYIPPLMQVVRATPVNQVTQTISAAKKIAPPLMQAVQAIPVVQVRHTIPPLKQATQTIPPLKQAAQTIPSLKQTVRTIQPEKGASPPLVQVMQAVLLSELVEQPIPPLTQAEQPIPPVKRTASSPQHLVLDVPNSTRMVQTTQSAKPPMERAIPRLEPKEPSPPSFAGNFQNAFHSYKGSTQFEVSEHFYGTLFSGEEYRILLASVGSDIAVLAMEDESTDPAVILNRVITEGLSTVVRSVKGISGVLIREQSPRVVELVEGPLSVRIGGKYLAGDTLPEFQNFLVRRISDSKGKFNLVLKRSYHYFQGPRVAVV